MIEGLGRSQNYLVACVPCLVWMIFSVWDRPHSIMDMYAHAVHFSCPLPLLPISSISHPNHILTSRLISELLNFCWVTEPMLWQVSSTLWMQMTSLGLPGCFPAELILVVWTTSTYVQVKVLLVLQTLKLTPSCHQSHPGAISEMARDVVWGVLGVAVIAWRCSVSEWEQGLCILTAPPLAMLLFRMMYLFKNVCLNVYLWGLGDISYFLGGGEMHVYLYITVAPCKSKKRL